MDSWKNKNYKLRKKAEEIARNQFDRIENQSQDVDDVIHNLHVHQIELEMQNEELINSQIKLEESRRKYFDLYNFAPIGFFSLDKNGLILETNLTLSTLLGVGRVDLYKKAFIQYISPDCRNKFHKYIQKVQETKTKQTIELELIKSDNTSIYVLLETIIALDENGKFQKFRIVVTDITQLKNTGKKLNEYMETLEERVDKRTYKLNKTINELNSEIDKRKKAEKALKESEENFRAIVENAIDAIIIVVDKEKNVYANPKAIELTGYSEEELLNTHFEDIIHPDEIINIDGRYNQQNSGRNIPSTYETRIVKKNAQVLQIEISAVKTVWKNKPAVMVQIHDITQRKKAEKEVKKSLEEKEVLIREIHHRVTNNLQIIASLLHLQEYSVNEETEIILKESEARVKTMAAIHEKLYQSPTLSELNIKQYIEKLLFDILYTYGVQTGTIETNFELDDINLNIETAIPLGLIINELITNIVKYAFPNSKGIIKIKLKSNSNQLELTIADNGIGIPKDINIEDTETLGLQLVNNLVNQLDGKLKLNADNGTEFKIVFKELKYKYRV